MKSTSSLKSLSERSEDLASLYSAAKELDKELQKIIQSETSESSQAVSKAEELYQISTGFIEQLYDTNVAKTLEVPLNIVEDQVGYLCESKLQQYDDLTLAISRSCRILMEITALNFIENGRPILETTSSKVTTDLTPLKDKLTNHIKSTSEDFTRAGQDMRLTLIMTLFEVKCIRAAVKEIDYGAGKVRELGKELSLEVLEGVLKGIATLSPSELISPALKVAIRVHSELQKKWYQDIWAIRWLDKGSEAWNDSFIDSIIPLRQKARTNVKLSLYLSEKYIEIIRRKADTSIPSEEAKEAEDKLIDLKKRVFERDNSNLIIFAKETGGEKRFWKRFWQVRYCSIKYLAEIAESPQLITSDTKDQMEITQKCIMTIILRVLMKKEKDYIKDLGARAYETSTKQDVWQKILNEPGTQQRLKKLLFQDPSHVLKKLKNEKESVNKALKIAEDKKDESNEKLKKNEDTGEQSGKIRHWKKEVERLAAEEVRLQEELEDLDELEQSYKATNRFLSVIGIK